MAAVLAMAAPQPAHTPQAPQAPHTAPVAVPPFALQQQPFLAIDNEKKAVSQRFRRTAPEFAAAFGQPAFTYPTSFGLLTVWHFEANFGETVVTPLKKMVTELLNEKTSTWNHKPLRSYSIACYFIGLDQSHASPHVVIVCSHRETSMYIRDTILDSKILSLYPQWAIFRLPKEAHRDATTAASMPDPSSLDTYEIFASSTRPFDPSMPQLIEVRSGSKCLGRATIGGNVRVDGHSYALTVAHAFCSFESPESQPFEIDESELGFLVADDEDSDNFDELTYIPDSSSLTAEHPAPSSSDSVSLPTTPGHSVEWSPIGRLKFISDLRPDSNDGHNIFAGLDWALVEIYEDHASRLHVDVHPIPVTGADRGSPPANDATLSAEKEEPNVVIRTAHGDLSASSTSGSLEQQHGTFGLPLASSAQPVIAVSTRGTQCVQLGDSGSWVSTLSPKSDAVGMVIGSTPFLHETYILSFSWILKDIERQIGTSTACELLTAAVAEKHPIDLTVEVPEATSISSPVVSIEEVDSSKVTTAEPLEEKVFAALVRSDSRWEEFLPADAIESLVIQSTVRAQLLEAGVPVTTELTDWILARARKVFLILVCIDSVDSIEIFRKHGFADEVLPVELEKQPDKAGVRWVLQSLDGKAWSSMLFNWKSLRARAFADQQWMFLAPVFNANQFLYTLVPRTPLPFIRIDGESQEMPESGFFGSVRKAQLHSAHIQGLSVDAEPNHFVAVKRINADVDHLVENELRALQAVHDRPEMRTPHLIRPIAAIQMGNELSFVFPWASGGNLRYLWQKDPNPSPVLFSWFLKQLSGIADALSRLHGDNGLGANIRHGDLKPENMLLDTHNAPPQEHGTLIIADLGAAKLHREITQRREVADQVIQATFRYEAPEAAVSRPVHLSRSADLWSLGCTILEFIIWIVYGKQQLREFNAPGRFESYWRHDDHGGTVISPYVVQWISHMGTNLPANTPIRDVFVIVRDRLLVIEPKQRAKSRELADLLSRILRKASEDDKYLFDDSIWKKPMAPLVIPKQSTGPGLVRQDSMAQPVIIEGMRGPYRVPLLRNDEHIHQPEPPDIHASGDGGSPIIAVATEEAIDAGENPAAGETADAEKNAKAEPDDGKQEKTGSDKKMGPGSKIDAHPPEPSKFELFIEPSPDQRQKPPDPESQPPLPPMTEVPASKFRSRRLEFQTTIRYFSSHPVEYPQPTYFVSH